MLFKPDGIFLKFDTVCWYQRIIVNIPIVLIAGQLELKASVLRFLQACMIMWPGCSLTYVLQLHGPEVLRGKFPSVTRKSFPFAGSSVDHPVCIRPLGRPLLQLGRGSRCRKGTKFELIIMVRISKKASAV